MIEDEVDCVLCTLDRLLDIREKKLRNRSNNKPDSGLKGGLHRTYAGTSAPMDVIKVLYSPKVMGRSLFMASSMDLLSRLSDPSSSSPMSNSVEFVMYFFHA